MIATSADPEIFKELLYGKRALQDAYERSDLTVNFVSCVEDSTLQGKYGLLLNIVEF